MQFEEKKPSHTKSMTCHVICTFISHSFGLWHYLSDKQIDLFHLIEHVFIKEVHERI